MKATLITRVDSTNKSVHIYGYGGQTWAFVAHANDPAYDYVVRPNGETREVTTDYTHPAPQVPEELWNQYMDDCIEGGYGERGDGE